MKKHAFQLFRIGLITLVTVAFAVNGFGMPGNDGRLIPMGKVYLMKDGKTVGAYSSEAPLPDGTLLRTEGDCAVKLPDLYLVAVDKSRFAIRTAKSSRELRVKDGTVYFALSRLPQALVFSTPQGFVTAQQVVLNAATEQTVLKGYVTVSSKGSEIGVIEGGSLLVSTADGEKRIKAGNRILLAQASPAGGAAGGVLGGTGGTALMMAPGFISLLGTTQGEDNTKLPGSPASPQ